MGLIYGWVRLFRSISNNVDYGNDLRVYLHLLLNATYKNQKIDDTTLSAGQLITSYQSIADSLGLSREQVRTSITHLAHSGVIDWHGLPQKYSICTISHYDMQCDNNAYNYAKLYRSIQGATWYRDGVTANLYYYILLHSGDGNFIVKRGDIINAINISPRNFYTALDRLQHDGMLKYSKDGVYYVISTHANYTVTDDNDKPTNTNKPTNKTTTKPNTKPNNKPNNDDIFAISDEEAAAVMAGIFGS